jgi:hypothetical protein
MIAVWGLRTYALCERNKIIAASLGAIGAAVIVALIVSHSVHSFFLKKPGLITTQVREPFTKCSDPAILTRRKYPTLPLLLDSYEADFSQSESRLVFWSSSSKS